MKTNKIIVVGGGSAGWMAAATLISQFPNKDITVIESPNVPTIGVGESTLPDINVWLNLLNIKDEDFMSKCNATYKLSISFKDFYEKNYTFHYPLGREYVSDYLNGRFTWFSKFILDKNTSHTDYSESLFSQMSLVKNNTMTKNENGELSNFVFKRDKAYQIDAVKFANWLRDEYCIPKGVKHIQENIDDIDCNNDGIKSLNKKYEADLYIDCTGFKALLIDKTLKEPFESIDDFLPNNSAWVGRVPYTNKEEQMITHTKCTAIENGWVWYTPVWDRIGMGYVYSDKFVSDDRALQEFKNHLKKENLDYSKTQFRKIKMRTGMHKNIFVKNVCAIGLSAGFIEPLESNGLWTVHSFLINLVRILNRGKGNKISQWDKDSFNTICRSTFKEVRDFITIHYALSHRDDTPYWKSINQKQYFNHLNEEQMSSYFGIQQMNNKRSISYDFFPSNPGLPCIAIGMKWLPVDIVTEKVTSLVNGVEENIENFLEKKYRYYIDMMNKNKNKWNVISSNKLTHYNFLKKYIYNE